MEIKLAGIITPFYQPAQIKMVRGPIKNGAEAPLVEHG
jgi:hypothetical protein